MDWQPRNDWVLVKILDVGETEGGLALPDVSVQGKKFIVRGVGSKVEGLKEGDEVLMIGQQNIVYFELPNSKDLIVIREENVVLVKQ